MIGFLGLVGPLRVEGLGLGFRVSGLRVVGFTGKADSSGVLASHSHHFGVWGLGLGVQSSGIRLGRLSSFGLCYFGSLFGC